MAEEGTQTGGRKARGLLRGGALVSFLVLYWLVPEVGWVHAVGLSLLLGFLPTLALAQVPLAREMEIPRIQAYLTSGVTLLVLAGLSLLLSALEGAPPLAFVILPPGPLLGWTVGLVVAGLLVTLVFKWAAMALGLGEDPILRALIPETREERLVFAGLSVCAGFGEEMAYRGYVLGMLIPLMGTGVAVVVSSTVFGLLHAYQGMRGMLRTGLMGAVMAAGYLMSGSLWPPILAHLLFDIMAGTVLAEQLMVPEDDVGVLER